MRNCFKIVWLFVCLTVIAPASAEVQIRGDRDTDIGLSGKTYGPISRQDTLWQIASEYKPDNSVSTYQVMLAIYQANKNAFNENNLNSLRNGAVLQLPTLAAIRKVNHQAAMNKSDLDDEVWQKKLEQNRLAAQSPAEKKRQTTARQADLETAEKNLQTKLNQLQTSQAEAYSGLQQQFKNSISDIRALLEENEKLKNRLVKVNEQVDQLRQDLGQGSKLQQQVEQVLSQQKEILANMNKQKAQQEAGLLNSFADTVANNLFYLVLLASLPAMLVASLLFFWLRKRSHDASDKNGPAVESINANKPDTRSSEPSGASETAVEVSNEVPKSKPNVPEDDDTAIQLDDDLLPPLEDDFALLNANETSPSQQTEKTNQAGEPSILDEELTDDVLDLSLSDLVDDDTNDEISDEDINALLQQSSEENEAELAAQVLSKERLDELAKADTAQAGVTDEEGGSIVSEGTNPASEQALDDSDEELDALLDEDMEKSAAMGEPSNNQELDLNELLADEQTEKPDLQANLRELEQDPELDLAADVDELDAGDLDTDDLETHEQAIEKFEAEPSQLIEEDDEEDANAQVKDSPDDVKQADKQESDSKLEQDPELNLAADVDELDAGDLDTDDLETHDQAIEKFEVEPSQLIEEDANAQVKDSPDDVNLADKQESDSKLEQDPELDLAADLNESAADTQASQALASKDIFDGGIKDELGLNDKNNDLDESFDFDELDFKNDDSLSFIQPSAKNNNNDVSQWDDLLAEQADDETHFATSNSHQERPKAEMQVGAETDLDLDSLLTDAGETKTHRDIDDILTSLDESPEEEDPYSRAIDEKGTPKAFDGKSTNGYDVDADDSNGLQAQLDLAYAYVEIEDIDSAEAALKRVIADGNDEQKSEAQRLLARIQSE
ncbi:FimV/HubP family polar landmark protein [Gayadomonas joobiniege]|uniref:FimV/HubP family polar landmark protein n=1 Tax=Gayadomonas joobiniege TaxID=1234606 RepID=UPI00036CA0F0|nr:FimV/HubP family polar landmark protein [Gayadomonas joobiniege]